MRNYFFLICAVMTVLYGRAFSPVQHACAGKIDRLYIYSPEMRENITVDVWTPAEYEKNSEQCLPVIYMHDGQNLFDANTTWNHQAWEMDSVISKMISEKIISPVMVVGIHSVDSTRVADLMPQKLFDDGILGVSLNGLINKPLRGDAYAKFVSTTLRDTINARYNTITDREHTFVMGSSMGGLMSAYMLCEYPEVYGGAGCLSTHWVGNVDAYSKGDNIFPQAMYNYLEHNLPADGCHKLYFDRGTKTIDAYYDVWDDKVISLCRKLGYSGNTLKAYVDEGAEHCERDWARRVHLPVEFLLKR